jgi:hypothetical protein
MKRLPAAHGGWAAGIARTFHWIKQCPYITLYTLFIDFNEK